MPHKKIGVLIGRFQGYHYSHHEHLRRAALENDLLIVFVGSPNARISPKNPWTYEQRVEMIEANIKDDPELNGTRIIFRTVNDHPNDQIWAQNVRMNVNQFINENIHTVVTIYGHKKDASSFYLDLFPEWDSSLTKELSSVFSATDLRQMWFDNVQAVCGRMMVHPEIPTATNLWLGSQKWDMELQREYEYYLAEKEKFADYPYPETLTFCCADAVVVCHDKVLMIRRKFVPGKGCLALPGGFKNRNETFFQAAIRELAEEAQLEMPHDHLMRCYLGQELFDNPSRSIGIPRATLAVLFDISSYYMEDELPQVAAADDAAEVMWVPIRDLTHLRNVYDDHAAIVLSIVPHK